MSRLEDVRTATAQMTAPALLRHLLLDAFPGACAVTSSLRARSIVVLKMVAEIDRSTPVVFCHASYVYPESVDYRAQIVRLLGLMDVRDPEPDEAGIPPGDQDHYEEIRSNLWGGGTIDRTVRLNSALSGFACWISAAYHGPYGDRQSPRLIQEGRLLRVDPLVGWSREEVHRFMAEHELPFHPRIAPPTYHY